jgi:hypothetical protein
MGEISGKDFSLPQEPAPQTNDAGKFTTDIDGVYADDFIAHGTDKIPVFDVTDQEFNQNMIMGRKRLRFKSGSAAQQYHQNSKYQRPFYIRIQDSKGRQLVRKIK